MSEIYVHANKLEGSIALPPFKSEVIRYFLLCALSGARSINVVRSADCLNGAISTDDSRLCDDIRHSMNASSFLIDYQCTDDCIDVGGSATLLRLLIPPLLAKYGFARFRTDASLYKRSLESYIDCIKCVIKRLENGIIEVSGRLSQDMKYSIDASASSQFASGMLLALPLIKGMRLHIDGNPVSEPYFELTLRMLNAFNILIERDADGFYLASSTKFTLPEHYSVEGDHSYAANFLAANYMNPCCNIVLSGLNLDSIQADAVAPRLFGRDEISIMNCPDLFPILCIAACAKSGKTVITGTDRLRDKESDRVKSMLNGISAIGGNIEAHSDHVIIHGNGKLRGGRVDAFNDHRIVMAFSIASLICDEPIEIYGADAVKKSAPRFFDDFRSLGGTAIEYNR
ncbi:MAG: hypothetical protein J1E60_02385 [Christensenellaceae bacterium]|nr:hypothetical protein [Christensenellaceae bacterium]